METSPLHRKSLPKNYTITSSFLNQLQTEWNEFLLEVSHSTPVVNLSITGASVGFLHDGIKKVITEHTNELLQSRGENLIIPVPLSVLRRLLSPTKFNGDDASKIEIFNTIKKDSGLTSDVSRKLKKLLFPDSESSNEVSDWPSPTVVQHFRRSAPPQLCPRNQRKVFTQPQQKTNFISNNDQAKVPVSNKDKPKPRIIESELNHAAPLEKKQVFKTILENANLNEFENNKNTRENQRKEQQYSSVYDLAVSINSNSASLFYDAVKHSENGKKWRPTIVFTYFSHIELAKMYQIVKRLGYFRIENTVTSRTTHLICGTSKKTMNLCKAVVRGCWILDKNWIHMSAVENRWLTEEKFEISYLWPAIKENRLKRQEYGKSYRCHVLKELGSVYVSKLCTQPTSDDLEEIITLAGGSLVNSFHKASFIVGPVPDREYVKEVWILNCILQGMVIDAKKYIRDHA